MQILLHRQACGRLTNVRYLRSGPVSPRSSSTRLRSPRAVQDLDRQSLTSAPRGTILKALLGGLILTAGFASSKRARPVMAAAGSDIEKVCSLHLFCKSCTVLLFVFHCHCTRAIQCNLIWHYAL